MSITEKTIERVMMKLDNEHQYPFLERCVKAVASRWSQEDGSEAEFKAFCLKQYIADSSSKKKLFHNVLNKIEKMYGLSLSLYWSNAWSVMMQTGPVEPVDTLFAEIDPSAHLIDDFYKSKLALSILLNFPLLSFSEKQKLTSHPDDRLQLAMSRLAELCQFRIPFDVSKQLSTAINETYQYLGYVMFDLDRILSADKRPLYQHVMQVDCHWGLRDQINLLYQDETGLHKQQILVKIWERAILEEVPLVYYENKELHWDPKSNQLFKSRKNELIPNELFHQGRYALLKRLFGAKRAEDVYSPEIPDFITRTFEVSREFNEQDCRERFITYLTNPLLSRVADKLKKILRRDLYAFDVIFNQFGLSNQTQIGQYDDVVAEKYPTLSDFQQAIPDILIQLGFEPTLSQSIAKQIHVVQCRSGGFASFPKMRGGEYILAVSAHDEKMDYMAFATAMHELGHCVERYLSSEFIDYYTLGEVPGDAFTEAFAFLFDSKCLELLDIEEKSDEQSQAKILNLFWTAYLNCGLALVDMECWRWMYSQPEFSVDELKTAVIQIARSIWNQYYASIFGEKDSVILAGYSPMFINPLYMPEYAMAIFIQTQLTHHLKDKVLGQEMPRMCGVGKLTPDAWMMNAVGAPISSKMLLTLTESVL